MFYCPTPGFGPLLDNSAIPVHEAAQVHHRIGEHRLVYKIEHGQIVVVPCRYCYGDR